MFNMCLTMLVPLFRADNSVKTFVAIVDVSLQEAAFAGNLPTSAGVYVLISLVFGQARNISRCHEAKR